MPCSKQGQIEQVGRGLVWRLSWGRQHSLSQLCLSIPIPNTHSYSQLRLLTSQPYFIPLYSPAWSCHPSHSSVPLQPSNFAELLLSPLHGLLSQTLPNPPLPPKSPSTNFHPLFPFAVQSFPLLVNPHTALLPLPAGFFAEGWSYSPVIPNSPFCKQWMYSGIEQPDSLRTQAYISAKLQQIRKPCADLCNCTLHTDTLQTLIFLKSSSTEC